MQNLCCTIIQLKERKAKMVEYARQSAYIFFVTQISCFNWLRDRQSDCDRDDPKYGFRRRRHVLNSVSFHVVPTVPWRRDGKFIYYYYTLIGERVSNQADMVNTLGRVGSEGRHARVGLVARQPAMVRAARLFLIPGPLAACGNLENTGLSCRVE